MNTKFLFICLLFLIPICSFAFGEKTGMNQNQFLDFMAKGLLQNKDDYPDEIAARGLLRCYIVKDGSSKIVDF